MVRQSSYNPVVEESVDPADTTKTITHNYGRQFGLLVIGYAIADNREIEMDEVYPLDDNTIRVDFLAGVINRITVGLG